MVNNFIPGTSVMDGTSMMTKNIESAIKRTVDTNDRDLDKEGTIVDPTEESSYITGTENLEPHTKKMRLSETVDNFIHNIVNSKQPLRAVLSDEFYKPLPLTKVYIGQVKSMKKMSQIITTLNEKVPLKELSHLKRACKSEVVLFPTAYLDELTDESVEKYIESNINDLKDEFISYKILDVPAIAPKLRKHYKECISTWSCNFHPNINLEKIFNGENFSSKEIQKHRFFMGMAFEVAKYYLSKKINNLEVSDVLSSDLNATIVVDPSFESVVAVAFDNRIKQPVQHSAMLAIDNVARTQNGGAWSTPTNLDDKSTHGIEDIDLAVYLKNKYPDIKFGSKTYFTKAELEKNKVNAWEGPYLCTGYDIYMIREPCLMCAMGLVHARSKRVFFCTEHQMGAVCSKTKLQCVPSLNHHFEVYTDFL